jgi:hypothetical protein
LSSITNDNKTNAGKKSKRVRLGDDRNGNA